MSRRTNRGVRGSPGRARCMADRVHAPARRSRGHRSAPGADCDPGTRRRRAGALTLSGRRPPRPRWTIQRRCSDGPDLLAEIRERLDAAPAGAHAQRVNPARLRCRHARIIEEVDMWISGTSVIHSLSKVRGVIPDHPGMPLSQGVRFRRPFDLADAWRLIPHDAHVVVRRIQGLRGGVPRRVSDRYDRADRPPSALSEGVRSCVKR
jgi:hypothetical protein